MHSWTWTEYTETAIGCAIVLGLLNERERCVRARFWEGNSARPYNAVGAVGPWGRGPVARRGLCIMGGDCETMRPHRRAILFRGVEG